MPDDEESRQFELAHANGEQVVSASLVLLELVITLIPRSIGKKSL
jgi:hypothetical protein